MLSCFGAISFILSVLDTKRNAGFLSVPSFVLLNRVLLRSDTTGQEGGLG